MTNTNDSGTSKKSVLRALRLDLREILPIGALFLVTMLCWCIAEFSTVIFQSRIDEELRTVTASDISVSTRTMPAEIDRGKLRSTAEKFGARVTEAIEFPYTLEIPKNPVSAGTGSRFLTTEIRIVDSAYPLYGEIVSSGSLRDGALASSELARIIGATGFEISGKRVPVSGSLAKAPGLSSNPFSANQDILVPVASLPFETVTASGAGYRVEYQMDFAVSPENHKALLAELLTRFGPSSVPSFRIREQRGEGGNFSDIATTLNDFLGSILYASALIALSSFVVTVSRFAIERQKTVRTLLWMWLPESRLVRAVFGRLLGFFGGIGLACLILFFLLPGIDLGLAAKGGAFFFLAVAIGCWILAEILLRDTRVFRSRLANVRAWFVAAIFLALAGYLWLSSGSYRPLAYSIGAIVLLERFSWGFFLLASKLFGTSEKFSKPRFFLLDALRSFRSAPALGKVSFSVFFLLSATLTAVFLFSLAFRDALRVTTESPINAFAINLLPKDYETLSKWTPPEDFYSTMRARIVTINGKSLQEHLDTDEVSREFSREFNITDGKTDNMILAGKPVGSGNEVTVDQDFSKRIGIGLGDRVQFSLAGRNFDFLVVGIRESVRNRMGPFFYFQIAPGSIAGAPKTYFLATGVTGDREAWKSRVIGETGTHVSFIDVGAILEQVRSYSRLVLSGVLALFGYIAAIGLLAFLTAERSFFLLKIRKIQLYRLLGCTEKEGFQLLFFESALGNMVPVFIGSLVGASGLIFFLRDNPILRITPTIGMVAFGALAGFFALAYGYARYAVRGQIRKTEPRIGGMG